jgi:two-component system, LytTR family, response regulator AlgR
MNVLIVDDETLAREHLSQLLGSLEGYTCPGTRRH